ncbi:hypothetical protein CYMTET_12242 [Cymbomonas tetramitiformis]|uniref:Uncharacterized protein n=1 Tax=Cymbomonas tetramitiformis TaxID=36881 RepID=A0AAE0GKN2_9CHLO|nr:hypothetical protein CYMTET_12242 [Cymbomonas tetramitiformis]
MLTEICVGKTEFESFKSKWNLQLRNRTQGSSIPSISRSLQGEHQLEIKQTSTAHPLDHPASELEQVQREEGDVARFL